MSSNWRKVENAQGFPYYLNENTDTKQWDHPKFNDFKQRLDECNYIKYSVYRVASKFRVLQRMLHMEEVPLTIINGVFERHRLGTTEATLCLENCDLEAVLSDIYFASNKQNHTNVDIDFASDIMINFLYNVYDKERLGKTQVFCVKLLLAILSKCKIEELHKFIFNLCADHNNCITRVRLQMILSRITEVTTFLHEDVNFGNHLIHSSIDNCFSNSPGLVGVNETAFTNWLENNPVLLSWIPTMFRMKSAENVVHKCKCSVCKATPLMGLRYRCLKCYRYNLCQHCFFSVRISHKHKNNHPMREYSSETSSQNLTHSIAKTLCSLIRCSNKKNITSTFVEPGNLSTDKEWFPVEAVEQNDITALCHITPLSSPQTQLQVIIRQLEIQNQEFQQHMHGFGHKDYNEMNKYLEEHRQHIATQIQKLKVLKEYLKTKEIPDNFANRLESTPMIACGGGGGHRGTRGTTFNVFSPIALAPEFSIVPENDHENTSSTKYEFGPNSTHNPASYSCGDISTWLGGPPGTSCKTISEENHITQIGPVREMQNDLDTVLDKLQQILANNLTLDESLATADNGQLKTVVTEMEGMLNSLIDNVESSRSSSRSRQIY